MVRRDNLTRRLAIYPQSRGLGFVVLDGSDDLIEWGRYSIRADKARQSIRVFKRLLARFEPDELVLEDPEDPDFPRCLRIARLLDRLCTQAASRDLVTMAVPRAQVSHAFRGRDVASKDDRAILIAQLFPQLMRRLPPRRELWMSENESMAIFDAMALVLTVAGVPSEPVAGPLDRYQDLLS